MDPLMQTRRWTRAEYHRMAADGYFQPDERVELLDGEVVTISPQNSPHAATVTALQAVLSQAFGTGFVVRAQVPLVLSERSEPEPDLAIVTGQAWDYLQAHPRTAGLVIEVADTTLGMDRLRKGPLYAAAGIPEYWIVDLTSDTVEVCRDPGEQGYRSIEQLRRGQTVRPLAKPDITLAIESLLPPA